MTFLDGASPIAAAGLEPASEGPETTTGELVGIGFEKEAIDRNYWAARQKRTGHRQFTVIGDISEALYGDRNAWVGDTQGGANPPVIEDQIDTLFRDLEARRGAEPGQLANFPNSRAALEDFAKDQVRSEMQEERIELEERSQNRSSPSLTGGVAEFVGMAGAAVSDIEGLALLPFGAGSGSLARTMLVEGALGAGSEALAIPAYNAQAEFLERDAPDVLQLLLFGATFGAALPLAGRGIGEAGKLGVRGAEVANEKLLAAVRRTGGSDKERGAAAQLARDEAALQSAPAGVDPDEHAARIDAAEVALENGDPVVVRPEDVDLNAPADWPRIQAGIFAGESGGDYDALFGFSNREGGPFSNVRVTEMTVDQAIAFSNPRGAYGQWVKGRVGRVATPMGAYQVVGTTLRAAKEGLGLSGNEVMTAKLQDRIGIWILEKQGTGAWEGYRGPRTPGTGTAADTPAPRFQGYGVAPDGRVLADLSGGRIEADESRFRIEVGEIEIDQPWTQAAFDFDDRSPPPDGPASAAPAPIGPVSIDAVAAREIQEEMAARGVDLPDDPPARPARAEADEVEDAARDEPDAARPADAPEDVVRDEAEPNAAAADAPSSWIVVDRATSKPALETSNPKVVDAINRDKYAAVPARAYLEDYNQRVKAAGGETPAPGRWLGPEAVTPSNQPDVPVSAVQSDMFDDPATSAGAVAQADLIDADLRARLAEDPANDIEVPVDAGEDAARIKVSEILADLDDEAEFLEQLNVCMPKGVSNG